MAAYPGAIDYPAHPTNVLGPPNNPKGVVLHTPEEPADDYPGTPIYFAQPNKSASTTWFVSYLGFVYECVHPSVAPIANGVLNKPYPTWADPAKSLNRQTVSIEIEGYSASIAQTLSRSQRTALVNLVRWACEEYSIPKDRLHIIGHYQVASNRSDPGTLNIDSIVAEVQDEMTAAEFAAMLKANPDFVAVLTKLNQVDRNANEAKGAINTHAALPHAGGKHTHPLKATISGATEEN